MINKWRKKPVVIESMLLEKSDESIIEALTFLGLIEPNAKESQYVNTISYVLEGGGIFIYTLEGTVKADFGDYIIKGVKGEFYPCKPDIFALTYDRELVWDENI